MSLQIPINSKPPVLPMNFSVRLTVVLYGNIGVVQYFCTFNYAVKYS